MAEKAELIRKNFVSINVLEYIDVVGGIAPANPVTGSIRLYAKSSDDRLYYRTDAGVEIGPIQAGGIGGNGTVGTIPKFDPDSTTLANSLIVETVGLIKITGNLRATNFISFMRGGAFIGSLDSPMTANRTWNFPDVAGIIPLMNSIGTSGTDINWNTSTGILNMPSASATARGVITTGTQMIAGAKTLSGNLTVSALTTTLEKLIFNQTISGTGGPIIDSASRDITGGIISGSGNLNSSVGYRILNAAVSGQYIRGNGTNGVFSAILAGDLPNHSGGLITTGTVAIARLGKVLESTPGAKKIDFGFVSIASGADATINTSLASISVVVMGHKFTNSPTGHFSWHSNSGGQFKIRNDGSTTEVVTWLAIE